MKTIFLSTIVLVLSLASCQQKQFAYVQKSKVESFDSPKNVVQQKVVQQPSNETVSVASTNVYTSQEQTSEKIILKEEQTSLNNNIAENEVLTYNLDNINNEFEKLNKIEAFVASNEGADIETVKETELLNDISLDTNSLATITNDSDLPLNIPAFLWGCLLGGLGILIVYMVTEDKVQTKKAVYGCLTAGGVVAVIYIVLIAIGLGSGTL
jgi:hypothetical protein